MIITAFCLFGVLGFVPFSFATSSSHSGHSMDSMNSEEGEGKTMDAHAGHDMTSGDGQKSHGGETIHSSMVNGYHLTYKLIDMAAKMKGMENMPAMKATHHLMLFVKPHGGEAVKTATVGFLIENPDGSLQKKMTMAMAGGYGADVEMHQTGTYTIKIKAIAGKDKIVDQFEHEMKGH